MTDGQAYCHRCGSPLPQGSTFCPKCGTPVAGSQAGAPQQPFPMAGQRQEKGEKSEKNEKREKDEKGRRQGGYIGPVIGGLVLVWLGISFFLQDNNFLPSSTWWAYFLVGLGAILVLDGVLLYIEGRYGLGPIIGGAFVALLGVAAIAQAEWNVRTDLWPLVFVAIGILVVVGGLSGRRRVRKP